MIRINDYIFNKNEVKYVQKVDNHVYMEKDTYDIVVYLKDRDSVRLCFGRDQVRRDELFEQILKGDEDES